jgi:hypothetical protein
VQVSDMAPISLCGSKRCNYYVRLLISSEELNGLKSRDKVPCLCLNCSKTFYVGKNLALRGLKGTKAVNYCSKECNRKGRTFERMDFDCLFCKTSFKKICHSSQKFCSSSCRARYHNQSRVKEYFCRNCKIKLPRGCIKHCSRTCSKILRRKRLIENWQNGLDIGYSGELCNIKPFIREYILNKFGRQCSECGWNKINPISGRVPLQIHHKDGNAHNNQEDNLTLLCPNCHSLTENFGRLNKSGTRVRRFMLR